MEAQSYSIYSISLSRIVLGLLFLLVGALNIIFLDSNHEAGVLFPLPYFVWTGIPPAFFGLGILFHTLFTSFKFTISRVKREIQLEEKFIFRRLKTIPIGEIQAIKLGDTKTRYKYALLGLWLVYVLFTLESGFHQLNSLYAAVMVGSGITVLILSLLLIVLTRKEVTLETQGLRLWANITQVNLSKLTQILQIPNYKPEKSDQYRLNDYEMLTIGGLFIGLFFLIYFLFPFSTFVDIFLLIYGIKLVLATFQNSWGTLTKIKINSNVLIHMKGPLYERIYYFKNGSDLTSLRKFKAIHPFELAIIGFLFFQTIYATIRSFFLIDWLFSIQALILTSCILFALAIIIFRLGNYLPFPVPTVLPLLHTEKAVITKKQEVKGRVANYFEDIVKFSQINAFYYRILFLLLLIFSPILIFTCCYPLLV